MSEYRSLEHKVEFASTNVFRLSFFKVVLGIPSGLFYCRKSPDVCFKTKATLFDHYQYSPEMPGLGCEQLLQHYNQVYAYSKKLDEYHGNSCWHQV